MLCARCKLDKDPQLFAPCMWQELRPFHIFCRKCCSERAGSDFGKIAKNRNGIPIQNAIAHSKQRLNNAKYAMRQQEMQRLLDARKARLADGSTP